MITPQIEAREVRRVVAGSARLRLSSVVAFTDVFERPAFYPVSTAEAVDLVVIYRTV